MTTPELKTLAPIKLALVCETEHLPLEYQNAKGLSVLPIPSELWAVQSRLVDRAVCETDTSTQQFIPYITLVNEKLEIFTYGRGKGSGEGRLIGKLSIGLGGHVDGGVPVGMTLEDWLRAEAEREVEEEAKFKPLLPLQFTALLRDTIDPTGLVHMGLSSIVSASSAEIGALEAGIIENGEWNTVEQLNVPAVYNRLENWSRAVLAYIEAARLHGRYDQLVVLLDGADKEMATA